MTETTQETQRTVRFGRRPQRGLLLGFTAARAACIALAVTVFSSAVFLDGATGLAILAPVWIGLLTLAFVSAGGRYAVEVAPTVGHFLLRQVTGQGSYRVRPSAPVEAGTLTLPGMTSRLTFQQDTISGAVLVHDAAASTVTAVVKVRHPAYVLLSPDEQARRVRGWGRVLAALAPSNCARLQVLEIALPDSGQGIRGWWRQHGHHGDDDWTAREYETLLDGAAPSASTHRTLIAVSLDLKKASRAIRQSGRGLVGAAAVLRQEMTSLETSLRAADLIPDGWLDAKALAGLIRMTYDPQAQPQVERGLIANSLEGSGPVAVTEHWDHLRHDSGFSAVLWISEWPRVEAPTFFLHSLVFQPGIRKTLSIIATTLSTTQAMRAIRKAKVEYLTDSAQKAKIGAVADLADGQELSDVLDRERALVGGHADIRFTGLVSVTAGTRDDLEGAVARVERAAIQGGCETRRLVGQQAQAFLAAALPLAQQVD